MRIVIRTIVEDDIEGCARVIASLPRFFGVDDNTRRLAEDVNCAQGGLVAHSAETGVLGFVTWRRHEHLAAEITWMAVHASVRHKGVGSALLGRAEAALRTQGCRAVTLLTSANSHTYEATRRFYLSRGYLPILRLPDLWPTDTVLVMSKQFETPALGWSGDEQAGTDHREPAALSHRARHPA